MPSKSIISFVNISHTFYLSTKESITLIEVTKRKYFKVEGGNGFGVSKSYSQHD